MEDTRTVARAMRAQSLPASTPSGQPRTWQRDIIGGGRTTERCEDWCVADHRGDARSNLTDLTHLGELLSVELPVLDHWEDGEPVLLKVAALTAQVRVDPYSENPRRNKPFVMVELADGSAVDELGLEGVAALFADLRKQFDRMEQKVLAQLAEARAKHGVQA